MMRLLVVCVLFAGALAELKDWDQYNLVWEDNMDFLDRTKWVHEVTAWGGGNDEFQVYIDDEDNCYSRDGNLHLKPTLLRDNINPLTNRSYGDEFLRSGELNLAELYGRCTNVENNGCIRRGALRDIPPVASTRIRTMGLFNFTYGRAEVRAKMPLGDWMWPAIWLLPAGDEYLDEWKYGRWPRSGEMDIVETTSNRELEFRRTGLPAGIQRAGATLHWGLGRPENRWDRTYAHRYNGSCNFGDCFHTYVMDWTEYGVAFYMDGYEVLRVPQVFANESDSTWKGFHDLGGPWMNPEPELWNSTMAPFDNGFHFIMNVAVGGCNGFIPDNEIAINRQCNQPGREHLCKPWDNKDGQVLGMNKFYERRNDWYWTWAQEGENRAMQVDYVRVYQRD